MRRSFVYIISVAFCFCLTLPHAEAKKVTADDLKKALAEKKASHQILVEKEKALSSEITELQSNLVKTGQNLKSAEHTVLETNNSIIELKARRQQLEEDLYKNHGWLGGVVAAIYRIKHLSMSSMLIVSDPLDAARAATVMRYITPEIHKKSITLKEKIKSLDELQLKIQGQFELQSKELSKINTQKEKLKKFIEDRKKIYDQASAARKTEEDEMKRLAKQAKNLEDLLLKITPKEDRKRSKYKLPENILLPVEGRITTGFGEKDALGSKSRGLTFSTAPESSVVTPLAGKVRFAGPFQKYRQILIIEHKDGYHSLIAGLGAINTVVGASLAAGEPVGTTEESRDASARLYYELRLDGQPVDPQKLLVAQRRQKQVKG